MRIKGKSLDQPLGVAFVLLLLFAVVSAAVHQSCTAASAGLVDWWPAEGNANDLIGGNHGVLMNGATFAPGRIGQGFSLDGADDFVEVPHTAGLNLPVFSVGAWVFFDRAENAGQRNFIVAKGDGASAQGGFFLAHDDLFFGSNSLVFSVDGGPGLYSYVAIPDAFPVPAFYHLAGTFDGSVARLYVNGNLVGTGSPSVPMMFNSYSLRIGASHQMEVFGVDDRFRGIIDEVGLFDRALTDAEIEALVPEPEFYALVMIGLVGLTIGIRRFRHRMTAVAT
jgi:hypothetical protein